MLILGLGLVSRGWAAPGITLPPAEDPRAWRSAALLAGVTIGCDAGPCVAVRVVGDTWVLRVGQREGQVPAPHDEQSRAAVTFLAASLATPLPSAPPRPPRPAPQRAPRASPPQSAPPSSAPIAQAPSAPEPVPLAPTPPPAPLASEPPEAPEQPTASQPTPLAEPAPPASPGVRLDAQAFGGALLLPGATPALYGSATIGVGLDPVRVLAGAGLGSVATLDTLDPRWTESRADLYGAVALAVAPWLAVGAGAGASHRRWAALGTPVADTWIPYAFAHLEGRLPLGRADLTLTARPALDLQAVTVQAGSVPVGELSAFTLTLGAGVTVHLLP